MKRHPQFPYTLYLVISQADCKERSYLHVAEQAILGGVDIVQLREKNFSTPAFLSAAKHLKEICDKYDVPLIINDNVDVAMALPAAGIHVGNNDMAPMQIRERWCDAKAYIGYSIEYLDQLDNEQARVSDYLGISPVFSTPTKSDTITEWGIEGIATIRERTNKPLVGIGNIHKGNAQAIRRAGADCIAVVSAICAAQNPRTAAYELKNEILK